jgi:hypothetical protein
MAFPLLSAEAAALRSRGILTRHCEPSSQDESEAIQGAKRKYPLWIAPYIFIWASLLAMTTWRQLV